MKTRFLLLFFFVLGLLNAQAQQDSTQKRKVYNPFEKYGYTKEILTLSKGRYQEFFPNDTLQRIGSVIYNIHTKQVVKILPPDTLRIDPEVPARWWGVDPLAEKFPEQSPYNYVENNPIIKIDPDGREPEEVNCCGVLKRLAKTVYKSVVKGKVDLSEVYSTIDDGVTLLSPNSTLLERGEALFNLVSPIDTKEIKAVGKTLGIVSDAKDVGKKWDNLTEIARKADLIELKGGFVGKSASKAEGSNYMTVIHYLKATETGKKGNTMGNIFSLLNNIKENAKSSGAKNLTIKGDLIVDEELQTLFNKFNGKEINGFKIQYEEKSMGSGYKPGFVTITKIID